MHSQNAPLKMRMHAVQEMLTRIDMLEVQPGEEVGLRREAARLASRMGAVQAAVDTHATIGTRAGLRD